MATQPFAEPLVSLEEYLDSDFQPDREFNDGVIEPGGKRRRAVYLGTRAGPELVPSGELAIAGTPILVKVHEIFDQLDRF